MKKIELPLYEGSKQYSISPQGLRALLEAQKNESCVGKNIIWTDSVKVQLPIRLGKTGIAAVPPTTLMQQFKNIAKSIPNKPALSVKVKGSWKTLTYSQYYNQSFKFASALLSLKFSEFTSINIIGFNAPQWCFAFYGSLFARCIPIGVYSTNNIQTCEYVARHSEAKAVLAENRTYAAKYYNLLERGEIQLIILYNDPDFKEEKYGNKVITYDRFIALGEKVDPQAVHERMDKVEPGNCCTLVYTSGTTGMPKAVMLSHDNYVWTKKTMESFYPMQIDADLSIVSYLPLSHVAAQFADIVASMLQGVHVFFADPSALQGSLVQTLQQVRPKLFFSVPRVWEKIYDKMMEIAKQNGMIKTKMGMHCLILATWAKSIGAQGTMKQVRNQPTSFQFKMAKAIVYNNVKKSLGLDRARYCFFGAAPLDPSIRSYFLSLNIFLMNTYGMSQSTGPQNFTDETSLQHNGSLQAFREVGRNLPGTEITIMKTSQEEQEGNLCYYTGEICYRGRNVFMGYYKNGQETAKTIDSQGYLHSGDIGRITDKGVLFITGRAKELIITAGGENIPPILIQNEIKAALPFISCVMLVGDMRKYLVCLLGIREDPPNSGDIDKISQQLLASKGCPIKKVKEGQNNDQLRKIIMKGLKKANEKAISKAQQVQDFYLMPQEFTQENGLLTPTLKLKRKEVMKKYATQIEKLYQKPSL